MFIIYTSILTVIVTSENTVYGSVLASAVKLSCVLESIRRSSIDVALSKPVNIGPLTLGMYSRVDHKLPFL